MDIIDKLIGLKITIKTIDGYLFKGILICIEDSYIKLMEENIDDYFNKITVKKKGIKTLLINSEEYYNAIHNKEGNKMSNKEQLLNELEQIKKEFKEKIENVQKQIEEEGNKIEWWKPTKGELYYFILSDGTISHGAYTDISDIRIINNLNYFQTEQQAERIAFEQLLHRKLQKFLFENNEEEIDWSNENQNKHHIYYSQIYNELKIDYNYGVKYFGQVYFTSRKIAEKAIEEFKDDLIRYFTSDK